MDVCVCGCMDGSSGLNGRSGEYAPPFMHAFGHSRSGKRCCVDLSRIWSQASKSNPFAHAKITKSVQPHPLGATELSLPKPIIHTIFRYIYLSTLPQSPTSNSSRGIDVSSPAPHSMGLQIRLHHTGCRSFQVPYPHYYTVNTSPSPSDHRSQLLATH